MQTRRQMIFRWALLGLLGLVVGCDGGRFPGGSDGPGPGSSSSGGSDGKPVSIHGTIYDQHLELAGTVYLRDNFNPSQIATTQSKADGTFQFHLEGKTPPFLIWATLPSKTGGYQKTLYTMCDGATHVNLSPLTHLVSAMAIKRDPVAFYRSYPEAGAPDEELVSEAVALINDLLVLVYEDLGIRDDYDLLKDPMGNGSTGFRQLMDMLSVYVGNVSYTLYATATLLSDGNMGDSTPAFNAGPEAARAMLLGIAAAKDYFKLLYAALEDGHLDTHERKQVARWLASDFLDSGRGPDQYLDHLAEGAMWRVYSEGIETDDICYFIRLMHGANDHPVAALSGMSEKGAHASGFWCLAFFEEREYVKMRQIGFVRVGDEWKVYGNRAPFEDGLSIKSVGIRFVDDYYLTGLSLAIEDTGHRGQDLGIRKIAIFNGALPPISNPLGEGTASAVVLAPHRYGDQDDLYRIAEPPYLAESLLGMFYVTDDGLNLETLGKERNFYLVALNADNDPLYIWPVSLEEPPWPVEGLKSNAAQLFPVITAIGGIAPWFELPAGVIMGGPTVTWTAPTDEYIHPIEARIEWWNISAEPYTKAGAEVLQNPALGDKTRLFKDWTTAAFGPPPPTWDDQFGLFMVAAHGPLAELYIDIVDFEMIAEDVSGN